MYILSIMMTILFSIFSTSIMAYISMATPIGPWIAPTLVLLATVFFKGITRLATTKIIFFSVIGGSLGGILATAFGFSFPTLYFLDSKLFLSWMASPMYFMAIISSLAFVAGGLGLIVATIFENKFIEQEDMPFPIGQLVYKMIAVQDNIYKAGELTVGLISTIVFCALQNFFLVFSPSLRIIKEVSIPYITIPAITIRLDQLPMLWAIGFITGHVIATPLAVGAGTKLCIVDPLNKFFFSSINNEDFLMAFCSGVVIVSAIASFAGLGKTITKGWNNLCTGQKNIPIFSNIRSRIPMLEMLSVIVLISAFLTYFKFSIFSQIYLVVAGFICSYQVSAIAGKIGLALLGRFATFVMIPAYIVFGLSYTQVVIVATFIEAASGIATDALFGRKTAHLEHLSAKKVVFVQWIGLVASSLTLGCVMWLLIDHFGLGSEELVAQRSQARALLLNFTNFNYVVLLVGAFFGLSIEKLFKISPMLMLGGLLMSFNYSLILILGGLSTYLVKRREDYEPFWSGVFAGNSIWVVLQALLK